MANYDFSSLYPQAQTSVPFKDLESVRDLLQQRLNDKKMKNRLDKLDVLLGIESRR